LERSPKAAALISALQLSRSSASLCQAGGRAPPPGGGAERALRRRAFSEDLRREFSASMEKLSPLIARIGEVDRLIDAIVYRLYGLTAAEIAIVEGSLS
jgi:hypothetical protein